MSKQSRSSLFYYGSALLVSACVVSLAYLPILQSWELTPVEKLQFDTRTIHIDDWEEGELRTVQFRAKNVSSQTVEIVGEYTSCDCTTSIGLPVSIAPGKSLNLPFEVHLARHDEDSNRELYAVLFIDGPDETVNLNIILD